MDGLEALWRRWKASGQARDREALLLALWPLARLQGTVAARGRGIRSVALEDLQAWAFEGVLAAIDTWHPARASLRTWCNRQAQYAITAGIREWLAWFGPRQRRTPDYLVDLDPRAPPPAESGEIPEAWLAPLPDLTRYIVAELAAGRRLAGLAEELGMRPAAVYLRWRRALVRIRPLVAA